LGILHFRESCEKAGFPVSFPQDPPILPFFLVDYNICMKSCLYLGLFVFALFATAPAQTPSSPDNQPHIEPRKTSKSKTQKTDKQKQPSAQEDNANQAENPGQRESSSAGTNPSSGESSSRDSQVDFANQPKPKDPVTGGPDARYYPFDPHKAAKDVEVGKYYYGRRNYRAALDRFREALLYKPSDAEATYGVAQTLEKMDLPKEAYANYEGYLKILPGGPLAKDAHAAMARLEPSLKTNSSGAEEQASQELEKGEEFLSRNQFEPAHAHFAEAVRLSPQNGIAYFRLAESLEGLHRLDEARLYYKSYLQLQPQGKYVADARRAIDNINLVLGK
jgi:tetratricopeptide (TPR) repeat protein